MIFYVWKALLCFKSIIVKFVLTFCDRSSIKFHVKGFDVVYLVMKQYRSLEDFESHWKSFCKRISFIWNIFVASLKPIVWRKNFLSSEVILASSRENLISYTIAILWSCIEEICLFFLKLAPSEILFDLAFQKGSKCIGEPTEKTCLKRLEVDLKIEASKCEKLSKKYHYKIRQQLRFKVVSKEAETFSKQMLQSWASK